MYGPLHEKAHVMSYCGKHLQALGKDKLRFESMLCPLLIVSFQAPNHL